MESKYFSNTFNASDWVKFGTKFFQGQDEYANFVDCAKICNAKHATLPCVENPSEDDFLFDSYGYGKPIDIYNKSNGNPIDNIIEDSINDFFDDDFFDDIHYSGYWIGLYQTPGTNISIDNWENWIGDGCNTSYRNFAEEEPNDSKCGWLEAPCSDFSFRRQEACAVGTADGWRDISCDVSAPCVCQYAENVNNYELFYQKYGILLLKEANWYILTLSPVPYLILGVVSFVIGIYLAFLEIEVFKKIRQIEGIDYASKKILRVLLLDSALVCSLLRSGFSIGAPFNDDWLFFTPFFGCFDLLYGFAVSIMKIFDLIDSAALATGGLKATKKFWIQFLRRFLIITTIPILYISYAEFFHQVLNDEGVSIFFLLILAAVCTILSPCCLYVYHEFRKLIESYKTQEYPNNLHIPEGFKEVKKVSFLFGVTMLILGFGPFILCIWGLTRYYWQVFSLGFQFIYYIIIKSTANITKITKGNAQKKGRTEHGVIIGTSYQNGIAIRGASGNKIGEAPLAPVPDIFDFTPSVGQADFEPIKWSISLKNLINFLELCMRTETWKILVAVKGEENICMHDINAHFVIPWTRGSGCSVALLFDQDPGEVQLMFSHSWSASVKQTYNAVKILPSMHMIPLETCVFFCTLCQYQVGDDAPGGLSIQEQLKLDPFSCVIQNKPEFGMYVIHTLISEVYTRLWCVFEVKEGLQAKIEITGLFDPTVWTLSAFEKKIKVNTRNAECAESDKKMLVAKIQKQGGFERLNKAIYQFRRAAFSDLKYTLKMESLLGVNVVDLEMENNTIDVENH